MALSFGAEYAKTSTTGSSTSDQVQTGSTKKVLSQEAIDKLIYDVLSSDQGLASLATGENLSGGFGSTAKSQLAQDFVVKTIGELANVMAETVTKQEGTLTKTETTNTSNKKGGAKTVICTHLHKVGLMSSATYNHPKAYEHYQNVHPYVLSGYHYWAVPLVAVMEKKPWLAKLFAPVCNSRYKQVISGRKTLGGFITITLGHPVCYALGFLINLKAGTVYGRAQHCTPRVLGCNWHCCSECQGF